MTQLQKDIYNIIDYEIDDIKDHTRVVKYIKSIEQRNTELMQRVKELETRLLIGCNECMNYNDCPVIIDNATSCNWKVKKCN